MDEEQVKQESLLETTDYLEAVGVFRAWKNALFIVSAVCLLLLQGLFWVVSLELVRIDDESPAAAESTPAALLAETTTAPEVRKEIKEDINQVQKAAVQVAGEAEPNRPAEQAAKEVKPFLLAKFKHLAWVIRLLNFVLIPAAAFYCLTVLFCLKISLLGRLGGINHIARAFFLSLLLVVLHLPRQLFFAPAVKGVVYTPQELAAWARWYPTETGGIVAGTIYYLRFTVYWAAAMLLLIFSFLRSARWARTTLRRLEIV